MTPRTIHILAVALLLALGGCAGQLDGVRLVFGSADNRQSGHAEAALGSARAEFAAGRFGVAAQHYQSVVAADPRSIEGLNGLAASFDRLGRFDVAERFYRQALNLDPASPQTLNNLGYSYYLQGRHDLAVAFLAEAARRGRGEAAMALNLAYAERALTGEQTREGGTAAAIGAAAVGAPPSLVLLDAVATRMPRNLLSNDVAPAIAVGRAAAGVGDRLPIVVVNGTGRPGMAGRIGQHLMAFGAFQSRLTNARRYGIRQTTIFHGAEQHAAAESVRRALPARIRLIESTGAAMRVELGLDLLDFDAKLLNTPKGSTARGNAS